MDTNPNKYTSPNENSHPNRSDLPSPQHHGFSSALGCEATTRVQLQ